MYDPTIGRFLSEDPSGLEPDENLYRYVENAPTIYVDPRGLSPLPILLPPVTHLDPLIQPEHLSINDWPEGDMSFLVDPFNPILNVDPSSPNPYPVTPHPNTQLPINPAHDPTWDLIPGLPSIIPPLEAPGRFDGPYPKLPTPKTGPNGETQPIGGGWDDFQDRATDIGKDWLEDCGKMLIQPSDTPPVDTPPGHRWKPKLPRPWQWEDYYGFKITITA